MLTEQAIQEFMLSRGGLRPKTRNEYRKHLALFQKCFTELPETPQPLQSWLNGIQRQRGGGELTPETIHAYYRTIRAMYRQIAEWHPEVVNPMQLVRPPRLQTKTMRTFTEQELYIIFTLPVPLRERAMVTLFLDTGIRAQECANLTWDDIRPDYIIVNGKTGERDVPISDSTFRLLSQLKAESNGSSSSHVFQGKRGQMTYEGVYKTIRKVCQQAGIGGKRASPHTFRHTFGTEYASTPGSDPEALQQIMGHQDFKTTMRYIHNNRKRLISNHQMCSPLRLLPMAAQSTLFESQILREAEAIVVQAREKVGEMTKKVKQPAQRSTEKVQAPPPNGHRCPKCGGKLFKEDKDLVCINCGEREAGVQIPPSP